jgi:hypothetical protein
MSGFATWSEFSASFLDASIGLVLIVKWTAVLALGWLLHADVPISSTRLTRALASQA